MTPHVKEYFTKLGLDPNDYNPCELCGAQLVDIHHIISRSHFGTKRKNAKPGNQDHIDNLLGCCRTCHDRCHDRPISMAGLIEQALEARKLKMNLIV